MIFKDILVILSCLLTITAVIPYLVEVVSKKTKPRIVSWLVWTIITSIAAVAALIDHQWSTAILLFSAAIETMAVVLLGWENGDKKIDRLDIICFIGAMIGIILWVVFNSPAIAVIATIIADLIGGIPTLVHSWKSPNEETWITYALSLLGATCTLLVLSSWVITSFAYPLYLVVVNLEFTLVIIIRKSILTGGKLNKKRRI
jgi:hypothetical protein